MLQNIDGALDFVKTAIVRLKITVTLFNLLCIHVVISLLLSDLCHKGSQFFFSLFNFMSDTKGLVGLLLHLLLGPLELHIAAFRDLSVGPDSIF